MIKIIFVTMICLSSIGCVSDKYLDEHLVDNIRYIKDNRTNICYAYFIRGYKAGLATVDCEKVEKLKESIKQKAELNAIQARAERKKLKKSKSKR